MVNSYIHAPVARRRVTATPVDLVVIRLVRSAMDADWAPAVAVPRLLDAANGDCRLLRRARARLLRSLGGRPTEIGSRALATIALALAEDGRTGGR